MKAERREYRGSSARMAGAEPSAARRNRGAKTRDSRPGRKSGAGVFGREAWASINRSLALSTRELQIVRGVFDDDTDFSIASSLGISPHTVHTHFERLHRKLGVANRAQLILRVVNEFLALTTSPGSLLPPLCPCRADTRCPLGRGQAPV
jgi:DNA-binding CsgD family transcriptional regulator